MFRDETLVGDTIGRDNAKCDGAGGGWGASSVTAVGTLGSVSKAAGARLRPPMPADRGLGVSDDGAVGTRHTLPPGRHRDVTAAQTTEVCVCAGCDNTWKGAKATSTASPCYQRSHSLLCISVMVIQPAGQPGTATATLLTGRGHLDVGKGVPYHVGGTCTPSLL